MKHIRDLSRKVEQLKKLNNVINEKYEGARKLNNKDRYIGVDNRSVDSFSRISTFRERRAEHGLSVDSLPSFNSIKRRHSDM